MEHMQITLVGANPGLDRGGRKTVNLALQPSDVHDPTEIPTYLAGYKAPQFRADELSPVILVDKDQDKVRNFSSDDVFRKVDVKGSSESNVPEVDPSSALVQYSVTDRFLGSFIPQQTEENAGANYQPRRIAAKRVKQAVMLDREVDCVNALAASASWSAAMRIALGATANWNGGSASDPIKNLQTLYEASYVTDGLYYALNPRVANAMLRHDKVRDHMRQFLGDAGVNGAINSIANSSFGPTDFAIPGFPPFKVFGAKVKDDATGLVDYIFPDYVVGIVAPPGVPQDAEEIATSYTFRRRGPSGVGFEAREYRVEGRGPLGGTMVVVSMADAILQTSTTAGGIITGCIA